MQKNILVILIGLLTSFAAMAQSLDCTAALTTGQRSACEKLNYLELSTDTATGRVALDLIDTQLSAVKSRLDQAVLDQDRMASYVMNEVSVHLGEVRQLVESVKNPRVDVNSVFRSIALQIQNMKSVYKGEM